MEFNTGLKKPSIEKNTEKKNRSNSDEIKFSSELMRQRVGEFNNDDKKIQETIKEIQKISATENRRKLKQPEVDLENLIKTRQAKTVFRGLHDISSEVIKEIMEYGLNPEIKADPNLKQKEIKKKARGHLFGMGNVGEGFQSFTNSPRSVDGFAQTSPFKTKKSGILGRLGVLAKN